MCSKEDKTGPVVCDYSDMNTSMIHTALEPRTTTGGVGQKGFYFEAISGRSTRYTFS